MSTQSRRDFLSVAGSRDSTPADGYWLHVSRPAMACRFEITLPIQERAAVPAATAALGEVDRLEAQLSVFRGGSEISGINERAAFERVAVEESFFELLLFCRELWRATDGAFDISSGPLSRCWGFVRREGRVPVTEELERARAAVGGDKLLFDRASRGVRFTRPGVEINLGSIGKGYALDRVAALIGDRVRTALLNAGASSLRAIGGGGGRRRGWPVGLRHPRFLDRRLASLRLTDCALSTSGSEEQFFIHEGKRYGHIIDPRSGWPASGVTSVTVAASSAALADALATAVYVGGPALAERYCATHRDVLALVLPDGADDPLIFGAHQGCEVEVTP